MQTEPAAKRMEPAAERMELAAERTKPAAERVELAAERVEPTAERMTPAAERVKPAAMRMKPAAERIAVSIIAWSERTKTGLGEAPPMNNLGWSKAKPEDTHTQPIPASKRSLYPQPQTTAP